MFILIYRISSNKRPYRLFNFETLRHGASWRAALKGRRSLFKNKRNYSYEISQFCYFVFPNNNVTTIMIYSFVYSRTSYFHCFLSCIPASYAF